MKNKHYLLASLLLTLSILSLLMSGCNKKTGLELSGTIEATQVEASSEVAGKVVGLEKNEGDSVKKGDVLAVLDSSLQKLAVKQQQAVVKLKEAKLEELKAGTRPQQLEQAASAVKSATIKAAEADLEQTRIMLEQAELILEKYQVRASIDGIYSLRNVNIGDLVNTGTSVATITDPDDLWVNVFIPQMNLKVISSGQELNLRVKALDNGTVKGRIVHIASKAEFTPKNTETDDAKENTVFKVRIKIIEKIDMLKPGMTVDAVIPLDNQ